MKESIGSLKVYLIVVAIFGIAGTIVIASESEVTLPLLLISVVDLAFSAAYLYIGIRLRKLLAESPKIVENVIIASMAYVVLAFLGSLFTGLQMIALIELGIGLLITWYLLTSARRLSQEETYRRRSK
ncbi:MAG: hypothetical protein AAGF66_15465 [Cyanobacteria bacterium P01_H01_bin.119]